MMRYTIKAIVFICAVAVVSFFVAQAVIPEKNAVKEGGAAAPEAARAETPPETPAPAAANANPGSPGDPGEVIPVVMIDTPAPKAKPAAATESAHPAAAPAATVADAKKTAVPEVKKDTVKKAVDPPAKAAPVLAATAPAAPAPAAAVVDAKKAIVPEVKKDTVKKAAEPPATAAPPRQAQSAGQPYKLERAALCASVENKAPLGIANKFSKDTKQVYYFTHITGARDTAETVIHRWYHQGTLIQTSILPVKSTNWRTHSKRNLIRSHEPTGQWKVEVVEPKSGKVLETATFVVE